jgi:hypothetical protein
MGCASQGQKQIWLFRETGDGGVAYISDYGRGGTSPFTPECKEMAFFPTHILYRATKINTFAKNKVLISSQNKGFWKMKRKNGGVAAYNARNLEGCWGLVVIVYI